MELKGERHMRILILTKSIICEKQLQEQLQRLDHEVFVSSSLLISSQQFLLTRLIDYFQVIIFGETVMDKVVTEILSMIDQKDHLLIRKAETVLDKVDREVWKHKGIQGWVYCDSGIEAVREQLSTLEKEFVPTETENSFTREKGSLTMMQIKKTEGPKGLHLQVNSCAFGNTEKRLVDALINKKGQLCSREELCEILWNSKPTNSKLSQLSSLIKRIKGRFIKLGIHEEIIHTTWGKGYMLTNKFNDYFTDIDEEIEPIKELQQ